MSNCKRLIPKHIFSLYFFVFSLGLFSQELKKPELGWDTSAICVVEGTFNQFSVNISFKGVPFSDSNNVFYLELSDENGSFEDTSKIRILRTLPGSQNPPNVNGARNVAYNFTENFQLSEGVFGEGYVIRVRTTSPELVSESEPFGAYYLPNVQLALNNYKDVELCGAGNREISIEFSNPSIDINKYQFQWKKDRVPYVVAGPTIEVSEPGNYRASIYVNGNCNVAESNEISVTSFSGGNLTIEGESQVEICADETHTFKASVENNDYEYTWFKDDKKIEGLNVFQPTYTTLSNNQFGEYRVEIRTGSGCEIKSQTVTLSQKNTKNFNATIEGDDTRLIFPVNDTEELKLVHDASNFEIRWYVDNQLVSGVSSDVFRATEKGVYFAEVVDRSTECAAIKRTKEITVVEMVDFVATIRTDLNYTECESSKAKLSVVGVKAKGSNDVEYDLSSEQLNKLQYQWYNETGEVKNETNNELTLLSYEKNGEYYLRVSGKGVASHSNKVNVLLIPDNLKIESTSKSNTLCVGTPIFLSVKKIEGYTYEWFKDDVAYDVLEPNKIEVSEKGIYKVVLNGFECSNSFEVEIKEFDDSVVEITPSSKVTLKIGEKAIATATGADSYEWFDEDDNLLSSTETLEVIKLGEYKLIAKVGECSVVKVIEVIEEDGKIIIPNIISPYNADGINDKWELPNRFSFKPNVRVIIYNVAGKEIFNTKDYQNNWPENNNEIKDVFFYFRIFKENSIIKSGTISVLE